MARATVVMAARSIASSPFARGASPSATSLAAAEGEPQQWVGTAATELPALYELKDGAPNLVQFEVERGTYIVPKVLEHGYLAIGKRRLVFSTAR